MKKKDAQEFTLTLSTQAYPASTINVLFEEVSKVMSRNHIHNYYLERKPHGTCPECGSNCQEILDKIKVVLHNKMIDDAIVKLRTNPKLRRR